MYVLCIHLTKCPVWSPFVVGVFTICSLCVCHIFPERSPYVLYVVAVCCLCVLLLYVSSLFPLFVHHALMCSQCVHHVSPDTILSS